LKGDKDERFVEEPSAVEPASKNFIALPWLGVWKSPKVEASEPETPWKTMVSHVFLEGISESLVRRKRVKWK